ncbi:heat-inducible transcriptional repressor HrcA [Spiroplasma endosymbiont of Othius punctulatus]|uniref:heat-inducible transcriptional repressor HrcA n=1 Tax=Spiroplasma endosymbiont of Othius punctulatus TaxID=3066289 RepID=UPI0030CEB06C
MLKDRQSKVLKIIVNEYIRTSNPVGSKFITNAFDGSISSATIRSDSAFLENNGYLEKTHTSSGRVPSTKGYRYFVDNLMDKFGVEDIKLEIEKVFNTRGNNVNKIIEESSRIISEMTKLATVVTTQNANDNELVRFEMIPISSEMATVIYVLSNGEVKNKTFDIKGYSPEDIKTSISIFNDRLVNTRLSELESKLELIKPLLEKQIKHFDFIFKNIVNELLLNVKATSSTSGIKYLLDNPEFSNPAKVKQVLDMIDHITPFTWFEQQAKEQTIMIGIEGGLENDDMAVISENFNNNGTSANMTLVGPKRLQYRAVSEILDWLKERINEEYK